MATTAELPLTVLYLEDETAWLDSMAALARRRDGDNLDWTHLEEYLTDMARRDRREVKSRLVVLMSHVLKWEHQPEKRSGSWRATIRLQSLELADLAARGSLRAHAEDVLTEAYEGAVSIASAESGLPEAEFPESCPYELEFLLAVQLSE